MSVTIFLEIRELSVGYFAHFNRKGSVVRARVGVAIFSTGHAGARTHRARASKWYILAGGIRARACNQKRRLGPLHVVP